MKAFLLTSWTLCFSSLATVAEERPNFLWLTSEDNSTSYIGCYGNEYAVTPHIDQLAKEGFRYTHCYSNGAVCSASRSSWIMGMISVSAGAHHHRSVVDVPESLVMYPQALSSAGYYTANGYKCDYNIQYAQDLWEGGGTLDWEVLQKRKPFFQIINYKESHESQAMHIENTHPVDRVKMAPYHPNTEDSKKNTAVYYDAITNMDKRVGEARAQLIEAGLAEDTIIIYCSDHGGALPRGKRYMYNSGTHCPLIVYIPEKWKKLYPAEQPGSVIERLVSFVDMPVTWLSLAGIERPANYQGRVFLGGEIEPEAKYHYSFRGRNDERVENVRAIRDKRYLLVKNYLPYVPRGQNLFYQWRIPMQRTWEEEYKAGRLNETQSRWFKERSSYELYDTKEDPHCIHNLIEQPQHKQKISELKKALLAKQLEIRDAALLPESMLNHRAQSAGVTPYEILSDPAAYDIESAQVAADIALEQDPARLAELVTLLQDKDPAVRYWAAQGMLMLGTEAKSAKEEILNALVDESHTVVMSAAWAAIKVGEEEKGYAALRGLLEKKSYAMLDILNQIAWMKGANEPLKEAVAGVKDLEHIEYQIQQYILTGEGTPKPKKRRAPKKKNQVSKNVTLLK